MRKPKFLQLIGAIILFGSGLVSADTRNPGGPGGCLVLSDGKGTLTLLWLPAGDDWPRGGWQIQDGGGKVLVARVMAGEAQAMSGLAPEAAQAARDLAQGPPAFKDDRERENFYFGLRFGVLTDPAYARALGFSRTLDRVSAGPKTFLIVGLDATGKPAGPFLKSQAADASIATPPPSAPVGFRAESSPEGVSLYWTAGPAQPQSPVFTYRIDRIGASGRREEATVSPILVNAAASPDRPRHVDTAAPVEQELSYSLYGVDVFGRRSPSVEFRVFHPDPSALVPPGDVKAEGLKGKVVISWTPNPSPNTRRILVERSYDDAGTYIGVTPQGLPNRANSYEDRTVPGGVTAFYRLRSVDPRGNPGAPTIPVSARPGNPAPPGAPRNLKADVGRTRVRLTWDRNEAPVSAYILERKSAESDWTRINPDLAQETQYDDPLGEESGGTVSYRLKAVALDNQESLYGKAIDVVLPERGLPPVPFIIGIDTKDGKAVVRFKPGFPESKTSQFLVLRSGSPDNWGVVLGRPLSAEARVYVDPFVSAGESYWYRVVAVNARNDRSDPSDAALVTIGTPRIPAPAAPGLRLILESFVQVRITFTAPPPGSGLVALTERKGIADPAWVRLPGATSGSESLDPDPPLAGKILYRVLYQAPNGETGPPSPSAEIVR
jgi:hypothetical protein